MSLSPDDKNTLNRIMGQLLNLLDILDRMPANPHAIDLLEIAGALLEQQVKEDRHYEQPPQNSNEIGPSGNDVDADDTQVIEPSSPLASFTKQASNAEDFVNNGLGNEIMQAGGFLFLNPNAKKSEEQRDIPTPDDLENWFNI